MMRSTTAVLLLVSIAFVAYANSQNDPDAKAFVDFMRKYNKKYSNQDEFTMRFANFKDSLVRSAEKNAKSKLATYGVTKFSDMSVEEFKSTILMKNPIVAETKPRDPKTVIKPTVQTPPADFDWRALGAVTAVKDQEQCGSCWAFSVTENIESMWILAGKGTNTTVDLSPQQIVDCDQSDDGCDGGDPPTAYAYVIGTGGLDTEASYPYTAEDGTCAFKPKSVAANITNWQYATEYYEESELQQNLVSWGPLSVCVDAANWQDYQSGVMTWEECAWINQLDHCVQLVGYETSGDTPYWIVRNSWNTDWGVEGYIYLEMWSDTCGIAHEATCSIV